MKRILSNLVLAVLAVFTMSAAVGCSEEKAPDARVSTPPIPDAAGPDARPAATADARLPDAGAAAADAAAPTPDAM